MPPPEAAVTQAPPSDLVNKTVGEKGNWSMIPLFVDHDIIFGWRSLRNAKKRHQNTHHKRGGKLSHHDCSSEFGDFSFLATPAGEAAQESLGDDRRDGDLCVVVSGAAGVPHEPLLHPCGPRRRRGISRLERLSYTRGPGSSG